MIRVDFYQPDQEVPISQSQLPGVDVAAGIQGYISNLPVSVVVSIIAAVLVVVPTRSGEPGTTFYSQWSPLPVVFPTSKMINGLWWIAPIYPHKHTPILNTIGLDPITIPLPIDLLLIADLFDEICIFTPK